MSKNNDAAAKSGSEQSTSAVEQSQEQQAEHRFRTIIREEIDAALDARGFKADIAVDTGGRDPLGPLNSEGAHEIVGRDGWFFTLTGWDRATTDLQRANLRTQLGLDENGEPVAAGPGPVGWDEGQVVNQFMYPLFRDGGPNGLGGRKWLQADGGEKWQYPRLRVRARGAAAIIAALDEHDEAKP
jgi:hypothetical protein